MGSDNLFYQAFIYLLAAVIAVPVAKRLGLGSVLGYLLAGVIIGPFAIGLVGDQEGVMHFAEFGVVMMLFLIGLELKPPLLWKLRAPILGLGGLQVLVTTAFLTAIGLALKLPWQQALAVGLVLALSSTAIVMQSLQERGLTHTEAGQKAFSVLLFQDIAVIPMLALMPLLATLAPEAAAADAHAGGGHHGGIDAHGWQYAAIVTATIAAIILGGRYAIRPLFRIIASTHMRELFVAASLLLVVGISLAMQAVGLSPALGAFIGGVVMAENEYRHEIEATIDPLKGLFLGLFFIAVGASIDFALIAENPLFIVAATIGLMVLKWAILFALGVGFKMYKSQALTLGFTLAQGGEFAFVLFAFCLQQNILPSEVTSPLTAAVALSMLLTPLVLMANEKLVQNRFISRVPTREADTIEDESNPVIVAGYGRFGQIVTRLVTGSGFGATVLDNDPAQIELLRRFHNKVFYGDAARADLLESAGAAQAKLLVVAVDTPEQVMEIVQTAQKHFPHLKILARASDRRIAYQLMHMDVSVVTRELFGSALDMGSEALKLLGMRSYKAQRQARTFRHLDEKHMQELAAVWEGGLEEEFIVEARQKTDLLAEVLKADLLDHELDEDHAWEPAKPQKKERERQQA